MLRTVLTAAVFIALVACGRGSHQSAKRSNAARSASAPHPTAKSERQQKKKGSRPDTTRAKNPLTN
jgi:Tfp pilus assembly protein PilP